MVVFLDRNDASQVLPDGRHFSGKCGQPIRYSCHIAANGPEMFQNEILGFSCHPTLPSRLMPMSFWVSAMNSIGSCWSTSRTKPLTMSATASSSERPRDMQ